MPECRDPCAPTEGRKPPWGRWERATFAKFTPRELEGLAMKCSVNVILWGRLPDLYSFIIELRYTVPIREFGVPRR